MQTVEHQGRASVHKAGSIQGYGNPSVAVQLRDLDDVSSPDQATGQFSHEVPTLHCEDQLGRLGDKH